MGKTLAYRIISSGLPPKDLLLPGMSSDVKGAVGSADLKISKSALLSLNHHNF